MSLAHQLSQLRPLMTRAEIEELLGAEQAKRALDTLRNPQRDSGVYVHFSHADEVIDSLSYTASFDFPTDVPVCGLQIGMAVDEMEKSRPDVNLADGETGEPNEHGIVRYGVGPSASDMAIQVAVKDGAIHTITLTRGDMTEALARRKRQEAERRSELDRKRGLANRWKSISDPNEMLLAWADHCSPWTDSPPERFVAFAQWLIAMPDPDVWHVVVTSWNWDYGRAPVSWVIQQESCDIATALEAFFLLEPSSYFRYGNDRASVPAGQQLEDYDLLMQIRLRLANAFYKRSEIAFDGQQYMSRLGRGIVTADDKAMAESFFPLEAGLKIAGRDPKASDSAAMKKCYEILSPLN